MRPNVLVITSFSVSSQNALNYACQLLDLKRYDIRLLHIYTLPVTYTVEGIALASVSEAFQEIDEQLKAELDRVRQLYPEVNITARSIFGGLIESLREQIAAEKPELVMFGTAGYYSTLWHTDSELLLVLRNLPVPVLIVPEHRQYQPIRRIGFACDYKNVCVPQQEGYIRHLVQKTGGELYVIHVTRSEPNNALMKENESLLRESLSDVHPRYFSISSPEVFKAVDDFINEHQLDLLIVIPRKHEFWYGLFHKNNIDQLAFLNRLPILALPGG